LMDHDTLDAGRPGSRRSGENPELLVGKIAVQAIANSPLMANLRELSTRIVKDMESSLSQSTLRARQGILQITSRWDRQVAALAKRFAKLGPPTSEMVFAAHDASKALSEGNTGPMDRFLSEYLKLPATPGNRKLLQSIIDSSLLRDIRSVREQWLVLNSRQARLLVGQVNRRIRLGGSHKAALLAYGTSPGPGHTRREIVRQRKAEELPTVVYLAWSDIQRPEHSSTLVDAAGNYLRVPLAGEKNVVQFEDTGRLEDAVSELGQEGTKATEDGGKHPLRDPDARQFEVREFELREAVWLDTAALKELADVGQLQPNEAAAHLQAWAATAKLSAREAEMLELDRETKFDTAAAAHEMGISESKARDYRSRYLAKLRRAAGL
jgi:hypothetical protein